MTRNGANHDRFAVVIPEEIAAETITRVAAVISLEMHVKVPVCPMPIDSVFVLKFASARPGKAWRQF
jgi:hypothetical protein